MKIISSSISAYGHAHNEETEFGSQYIGYGHDCIEAQTAWLALPEAAKVRAIDCAHDSSWAPYANSSAAITMTPGSTLTCTVTGSAVYFVTSRMVQPSNSIPAYSISVDGGPTLDYDESQFAYGPFGLPVNSLTSARLIRYPVTTGQHTVTYTCTDPGSTGCVVFYAAGVGSAQAPVVYSLSPVPNAPTNQGNNFDPTTYAAYYASWKAMVTELQSDGMNIVPVDVNQLSVYDPSTQSQPDGIHQNIAGHLSIGIYAAGLE